MQSRICIQRKATIKGDQFADIGRVEQLLEPRTKRACVPVMRRQDKREASGLIDTPIDGLPTRACRRCVGKFRGTETKITLAQLSRGVTQSEINVLVTRFGLKPLQFAIEPCSACL